MTTWDVRTVHRWQTDDRRLNFSIVDDNWAVQAIHIADTAALIANGFEHSTRSLYQLAIDCHQLLGTSSDLCLPRSIMYDVGDTGLRLISDGGHQPWFVAWIGDQQDDNVYRQAYEEHATGLYRSCDVALTSLRITVAACERCQERAD